MKKKRVKLFLACVLIISLFLPSVNLQSAEIKGVGFVEKIMIEETPLRVRGVALLKWAGFINVYAGAFYLPEEHVSAVWEQDVAKGLELSYFRTIKAEEFGIASDKLLQDTLTEVEYRGLSERLKSFYSLFRDVKPGDRYRLIYQPGRGTELHLNDQLLGTAAGADFARAYFGLWLGEQPISKGFRDRLLSGGA